MPAQAIAKVTLIEQLRNRLYLIILFFGAVMLFASILLGTLAPGHSARVILDTGLVALELFGLITAVFGAVTLVLQEIESKTIYLLLTRPVRRSTYIVGRFIGLVAAVALTMIVMAGLHVAILLFQGWTPDPVYPLLVGLSIFKMVITAAVAIFFSLFATSSVSALVFTGCFWVAGHFGPEIAFMIKRSFPGAMGKVIQAIALALPNFQYFNLRDMHAIPGFHVQAFLAWAILYGVAYTGFFLVMSALLFSRKEF
jgi:ABC-type transport system involved in multi-copper enzyme maturation permease subunit